MVICLNLRNSKKTEMPEEKLKESIIEKTNCRFENTAVLAERTGIRESELRNYFLQLNDLQITEKIFIVSAVERVNNDKSTRYMVVIDGIDVDGRIIKLFKNHIPVIAVTFSDATNAQGKMSYFSKWFRTNMGRAFSLIDLDFLINKPNDVKTVVVEEKQKAASQFSLGYGQMLSYKEVLEDVLEKPLFLYIAFTPQREDSESISFYKYSAGNFLAAYGNSKIISKNITEFIKEILTDLE